MRFLFREDLNCFIWCGKYLHQKRGWDILSNNTNYKTRYQANRHIVKVGGIIEGMRLMGWEQVQIAQEDDIVVSKAARWINFAVALDSNQSISINSSVRDIGPQDLIFRKTV